MKKNTVFIVFSAMIGLVFNFLTAGAQNTSPYWSLAGNSNALNSKFGTTSNTSLRILTNNVERMRIMASGTFAIGTTTPFASVLVDMSSTTKGILFPRMTTVQRNAISTPANGLIIYQTDGVQGIYYYNSGWKSVNPGGANISLSNIAFQTAINASLVADTNNVRDLGSLTYGWKNMYLQGALYLDGTRFISNAPNSTLRNTFLGSNNGISITTGHHNTGIGHEALLAVTTGYNNSALGDYALRNTTTGNSNTGIGIGVLLMNTTGSSNTAVGRQALNGGINNNANSAFGAQALENSFGFYNVAVGFASLSRNSGNYNTAVGSQSGNTFYLGNGRTTIGLYSKVNSDGLSNVTAIGFEAVALASNQVMLGNPSVTSVMAASNVVIYSDGRFKKNLQPNVPGMDFINQLHPLTYTYDIHALNAYTSQNVKEIKDDNDNLIKQLDETAMAKKEKIIYSGFIAQEVEAAAKKSG